MLYEPKEKIIYEKRFPKVDYHDLIKQLDTAEDIPCEAPESFEAIHNRMLENSTYVLVPDRMARKQEFIDLAISISTDYEIDVKIKDCSYYVSVTLYLFSSFYSGNLKSMFTKLIVMSDNISSFISNDDSCEFILSLDYYTHEHYVSGLKVDY